MTSSNGPASGLRSQLFRKKPIAEPDQQPGGLERTIGTFQLTMFGVGATIGTGIYVLT